MGVVYINWVTCTCIFGENGTDLGLGSETCAATVHLIFATPPVFDVTWLNQAKNCWRVGKIANAISWMVRLKSSVTIGQPTHVELTRCVGDAVQGFQGHSTWRFSWDSFDFAVGVISARQRHGITSVAIGRAANSRTTPPTSPVPSDPE